MKTLTRLGMVLLASTALVGCATPAKAWLVHGTLGGTPPSGCPFAAFPDGCVGAQSGGDFQITAAQFASTGSGTLASGLPWAGAWQSGQTAWSGGNHPWPWNSPGIDYPVGALKQVPTVWGTCAGSIPVTPSFVPAYCAHIALSTDSWVGTGTNPLTGAPYTVTAPPYGILPKGCQILAGVGTLSAYKRALCSQTVAHLPFEIAGVDFGAGTEDGSAGNPGGCLALQLNSNDASDVTVENNAFRYDVGCAVVNGSIIHVSATDNIDIFYNDFDLRGGQACCTTAVDNVNDVGNVGRLRFQWNAVLNAPYHVVTSQRPDVENLYNYAIGFNLAMGTGVHGEWGFPMTKHAAVFINSYNTVVFSRDSQQNTALWYASMASPNYFSDEELSSNIIIANLSGYSAAANGPGGNAGGATFTVTGLSGSRVVISGVVEGATMTINPAGMVGTIAVGQRIAGAGLPGQGPPNTFQIDGIITPNASYLVEYTGSVTTLTGVSIAATANPVASVSDIVAQVGGSPIQSSTAASISGTTVSVNGAAGTFASVVLGSSPSSTIATGVPGCLTTFCLTVGPTLNPGASPVTGDAVRYGSPTQVVYPCFLGANVSGSGANSVWNLNGTACAATAAITITFMQGILPGMTVTGNPALSDAPIILSGNGPTYTMDTNMGTVTTQLMQFVPYQSLQIFSNYVDVATPPGGGLTCIGNPSFGVIMPGNPLQGNTSLELGTTMDKFNVPYHGTIPAPPGPGPSYCQ